MRRPPLPQDNNHHDIYEHRDGDDGDDDDDHRGSVETNAGERDRADCYLAPFDNTKIWYVVVEMVDWSRGAELVFARDLNVYLRRTGGR